MKRRRSGALRHSTAAVAYSDRQRAKNQRSIILATAILVGSLILVKAVLDRPTSLIVTAIVLVLGIASVFWWLFASKTAQRIVKDPSA